MTDPTAADPAEPTGHTIDGTPWVEPRPPHLPDPVVHVAGRIPLAAWAFLAIAAAFAAWKLRDAADAGLSIPWLAATASNVIQGSAPALFGAALFARHPRAMVSDPRVVFGIVVLIAAGLLPILRTWLGDLLVATDPDEAFTDPSEISVGLSLLGAFLLAFGIACVARGLLDARAFDDDPMAQRRIRAIAVVAVIAIAAELWVVGTAIQHGDVFGFGEPGSGTAMAATIVSVGAQFLVLGAWVYFLSTASNGAAAGEEPRRAWQAAAVGSALVVLASLLVVAIEVAATVLRDSAAGVFEPINLAYWAVTITATVGYLALIAAFASGLPGTDDATDDAVSGDGPDRPTRELPETVAPAEAGG